MTFWQIVLIVIIIEICLSITRILISLIDRALERRKLKRIRVVRFKVEDGKLVPSSELDPEDVEKFMQILSAARADKDDSDV